MRQATLLFLIRDNKILLAMKKRGFGQGHWNGVGGKPDPGEAIEQTAIRECQEEIGVTPTQLNQVATLTFYFPDENSDWNQEVIVYLCTEWHGEPTETEEMAPKWFEIPQIPYDSMWPDDKFWLPKVLSGKKVRGEFHFNQDKQLEKHTVSTD